MKKHLKLLGLKGKDRVTGFHGVVSSVSFDLYGCIQLVLVPPMKDGKKESGEWFDINRIEITDENPVMKVPDFTDKRIGNGDKGSADKPIP